MTDVQDRLTIIALDHHEYFDALQTFSALGIVGGAIYDALLARCAIKARAETIYTWNTKDFLRLGDSITQRTRTPSSG